MRNRNLGSTGTIVSSLCLGTMTFGNETDEATAHRQLDVFVEAGGTFVDTADIYQHGTAEAILGRWIQRRGGADDLVVATKGRMPMGPGANDAGLSRPHLQRAVDASLERLGVEAIDLYQAHLWDPRTPLEETLATFDDLVRAGKIRYVGVSNFTGWQLQRAALLARERGWAPVVTLQPQYSLLARGIEWELQPLCVEEGIGILPWSPLGGGWLTGKYTREEQPTGETRLGEDPDRGQEAWERRNTARTWAVVDEVRAVADARGVAPAEVAIAWVTDRPAVSSTILGARTVEQLEGNLAAADLVLSDAERDRLDAVSAPETPAYPYGFIAEEGRR